MINLFAYGTLMCDDIFQAVSGKKIERYRAVLKGFVRKKVDGEHYPGIIASPDDNVEGVIYMGVTGDAWQRLDRFEGDMYLRKKVMVMTDSQCEFEADTYVIEPGSQHLLSDSNWNFEEFLSKHKQEFQRRYAGYMKL